MKQTIFIIVYSLLGYTFLYSQEFCDSAPPLCYKCDAATDEDLEVVGYENSRYLVNEIFVKVKHNLLPYINPSTAKFNDAQVDELSDSYGIKKMDRLGDSDYYVLTFENIKNLQCTMEGYDGLVEPVSQSSYFSATFPNLVLETNF